MKATRRTNRFVKRCAWGAIRSKLRQRFSKGNYEIETEFKRPRRSAHWTTTDDSRIRWMLKNRKRRMSRWELEYHISYLRGDTSEIERRFGVFLLRCPYCGKKLGTWGVHALYCPANGYRIANHKKD